MPNETEIVCPFCGEPITILIDTSVERQTYIEDCSVCCRPITIGVTCLDGDIDSVDVRRE